MTAPMLRKRLAEGEKIFAAWMGSGYPRMAEALGRAGFDAVIIDLQHGEACFGEARDAITAAHLAQTPVGVRVGLEGYSDAARLYDVGAELAIMPMINTVADARKLVDTLKYPPVGGRSWGGGRAVSLFGAESEAYRTAANDELVALAMIETRQAADILEDILDVPGLDGVFIGPSDLSISLSNGEKHDHQLPEAVEVITRLLAAAKARNKLTAIYCSSGEAAARNAELGFDILGIGSDWGFLTSGAQAALMAARGRAGPAGAQY